MMPKKRSIKKNDDLGNDVKKKKRKIEETPSNSDQKTKSQLLRMKEKYINPENSLSNAPEAPSSNIIFSHSNISAKVCLSCYILEEYH